MCGYLLVTGGSAGVMLAHFPAPDGNASPGYIGNACAFIFGAVFSLIRLVFPLALHAGEFEHGTYALVQLPLVLGLAVITMVVAAVCRQRVRRIALTGALTYLGTMLATNDLAFAFRVDHSADFPIGRALDGLDWRKKLTVVDVRRVAGQPVAEGSFSATDPVLPLAVREDLANGKRTEVFILAYFEEDRWNRKTTYYVMFDPTTKERFSQVGINVPISQEHWPKNQMHANSPGHSR